MIIYELVEQLFDGCDYREIDSKFFLHKDKAELEYEFWKSRIMPNSGVSYNLYTREVNEESYE